MELLRGGQTGRVEGVALPAAARVQVAVEEQGEVLEMGGRVEGWMGGIQGDVRVQWVGRDVG